MSAPTPNGRVEQTSAGHQLVLTRTLPQPIEAAWASITDPEQTARWFGRWEGTGVVGETVTLSMGFEDEMPAMRATITDCAAPHRLRILSVDEFGSWDLAVELLASGANTELTFTMHQIDPTQVGDVGPGWEFYLDQLVAAVIGNPLPDFDDYYPAQKDYFQAQVVAG